MLRDYVFHLNRLPLAAKLFLTADFLVGIGEGSIWVLRNLYLKKLGYHEGFIGQSLSISMLGMALVAVPFSLSMDRRPLKRYLVAGALALGAGIAGTALWHSETPILVSGFVSGAGAALLAVGTVPFYMRHSSPEDRPFLFGFGTAMSPAAALAGAGLVWALARAWGEEAAGMRLMLLVSAAIAAAGALVFASLRENAPTWRERNTLELDRRSAFRLCLPLAIIGLGAGLTIPFINLYFESRFDFSASSVSVVYGIAQVFSIVAFLASPLLARRFGGVRTVVACQMLSIPFFFAMAFTGSMVLAVGAFLARHALMNMAGPVNSQFAMEVVPAHQRVLTNGLREISWNATFLLGTSAGGWMIENSRLLKDGYTATMLATIVLYVAGSAVFYAFWRSSPVLRPGVPPPKPVETLS
jgi:MFS family permease